MSNKNEMEISISVFQQELFTMIKDLVWKDKYTANKYEYNVNQKIVDQFLAVNRGLLTFDSIYQFDMDALKACGFTGEDLERCLENKYYIPETMRDLATSAHCNELIKKDVITGRYIHYEEMNNYYRRLYGLPDVEDTDYIYNTEYDDIDMTIPIHELDISDRYTLEERGYIAKLLEKYPKKKYLKHIASKMVDPYKARTADRFDILWMNTSETVSMSTSFLDVYDNCRQTVIRTYYRSDMGKTNELYEGFIAMCILFMAINLMFYKYLETDITRDFFDVESLKYVYQSYGVPFYPQIPISLHKKIVKNINILLSYKGSTRVFYKLFDLFGYGQMDIYEYYILKIHKMESNGTPQFVYDENGNRRPQDEYDIKFGEVKLYEDPPLELADPGNHLDYTEMTSTDPYWVSDSNLMDKILSEKFNYQETKYLGIKTVFDMLEIVYESAYFYKIILDNRKLLDKTMIFFGATNTFYNIFDITIYIAAIICKKHGYEGLISSQLPIVSKIMGFNFKANITEIRKDCLENDALKDDTELFELLRAMNVNSLASINSVLKRIQDLKKFLFDRMWAAKTEKVYSAYRDLYSTLLTSDFVSEVFRKRDGTMAESFSELLKDLSLELYIRMNSEVFDPEEELDSLFILFEKSFSNLKWIKYSDGIDLGPLLEQLFLLLKFFKSAKAELTDYRIVYMISKPEANFIKFIGEIVYEEHHVLGPDDKFIWLTDLVRLFETIVYSEWFHKFKDDFKCLFDLTWFDDWFEWLKDDLFRCITKVKDTQAILQISDYLTKIQNWEDLYTVFDMKDCSHLFTEDILYPTIMYILDDSILYLKSIIWMIEEYDKRPEAVIPWNDFIAGIIEWVVDTIGKQRTELWLKDMLLEKHIITTEDAFHYLIDECRHMFEKVFRDDAFDKLTDMLLETIKENGPNTSVPIIDYVKRVESVEMVLTVLSMTDCCHVFTEDVQATYLTKLGDSLLMLKSMIGRVDEIDMRPVDKMKFMSIIYEIVEDIVDDIGNQATELWLKDILLENHDTVSSSMMKWSDNDPPEYREIWNGSPIKFASELAKIFDGTHEMSTTGYLTDSLNLSNENSNINDTTALFTDTLHLIYEKKFPDQE